MAPRRSGAAHLVLRIVFAVALVVLVGANAVRHGPQLVAAIAPAPSPTAARTLAGPAASPATSASGAASASASTSASASASASSGSSSAGGTGTGAGTGSGGSGTTRARPSTSPSAATRPVITNFDAEDVECPQPSGGQFSTTPPSPDVIPEWNSTGAVRAWFGIDTSDAKANPYQEVDPNGAIQFTWPCPQASQQYAITVEDAAGHDVTRTYTAHNTGYTG